MELDEATTCCLIFLTNLAIPLLTGSSCLKPFIKCYHVCSSRPSHVTHWMQVVGTLRSEVARELGLAGDVQVAPGSGDNQMSALGAGAVHEGTWVMSLGTSGTLFGLSTKPVLDPTGAVSPFCDATGSWLPLLCTMNCTTVTEEVSVLPYPPVLTPNLPSLTT